MKKLSDKKIIDSWQKNVAPWVRAINNSEIESRRLVTDRAIVDAVMKRAPESVLDVGCGEGWLVRALAGQGVDVLGVDVVPRFIEIAAQQGKGRFKVLAYEEISPAVLGETFDVVVCNFSLLGKESVEYLFQQLPGLINEGGALIVQTIHPKIACGEGEYKDGWREGSWAGFNDEFTDPAPWYFRTLESWQALFDHNGFKSVEMIEPLNPQTEIAASVIFVGTV